MSDFVTVAKFSNPIEANIARGKLESTGIPAFLKNELLAGIQPYFASSSNVIELQVSAVDAKNAAEILDSEEGDGESEDL